MILCSIMKLGVLSPACLLVIFSWVGGRVKNVTVNHECRRQHHVINTMVGTTHQVLAICAPVATCARQMRRGKKINNDSSQAPDMTHTFSPCIIEPPTRHVPTSSEKSTFAIETSTIKLALFSRTCLSHPQATQDRTFTQAHT